MALCPVNGCDVPQEPVLVPLESISGGRLRVGGVGHDGQRHKEAAAHAICVVF